jgi:GDP-4-dehydro-6-deoxy-D-mannose reductase
VAASCLITGVSGFIGSYPAEYLLDQGVTGFWFGRAANPSMSGLGGGFHFLSGSITDPAQIAAALAAARPDYIYHLAAQSLPKVSWEDPAATFQVNVIGTQYLLDAVRESGLQPVVEIFGSSSEYAVHTDNQSISEDHRLEPSSPYALSKIAAVQLGGLYSKAYQMRIVCVRPFFIIGPRKTGDVCSDFARRIVTIERGLTEELRVGNLDIVRDFLDVRDAVSAFRLVAERGASGWIYNICSGSGHSIGEIVENYRKFARVPFSVTVDQNLLRSIDEPVKIGDPGRLLSLGWKPSITFQNSLEQILAYWRAEAAK